MTFPQASNSQCTRKPTPVFPVISTHRDPLQRVSPPPSVGGAPVHFVFLPREESSLPLPLVGSASSHPHPLGPSACPSLAVSRALSVRGAAAGATEPARVFSGRKRRQESSRAPRRPQSGRDPSGPQFPCGCRGRMGLAWREQRGRGGRSAAPGGRGRAPGPAGPRTRRLSRRAGCSGRLVSAGTAARLAWCGPEGPRARHVAGFCPRRAAGLARFSGAGGPLPGRGLGRPSRGPRERHLAGLCPEPGLRSIHLFILSFIVPFFLPHYPMPRFPRAFSAKSQPRALPCGALCLEGCGHVAACRELEAQGFRRSWL